MSEPQSVFPMGGGLAGPMGGSGGGLPEDMMFARMAHLEMFIGSFAPHLIDAKIDGITKRLLIMAIRQAGSGEYYEKHPWKVTYNAPDPEIEDPPNEWSFIGDTVYFCGQGDDILVADGTVTGETGYVLLKITRSASAREGTAAEVIWSEDVLESGQNYQYRVLAKVIEGTPATEETPGEPPTIIQYQFEEIRLFEELVVINGDFALQVYEISHRNNYDLPP
jgi:hypothetical protein